MIARCFHLLLLVGFLFHSSSASACALNQVLIPDSACCLDGCGDCHSAGAENAAPEGHDNHCNDDGGTCICKAKGTASLTQHAAAAIAALHIQPVLFVSADASVPSAFVPSVLIADPPPIDVGCGLPLLF